MTTDIRFVVSIKQFGQHVPASLVAPNSLNTKTLCLWECYSIGSNLNMNYSWRSPGM